MPPSIPIAVRSVRELAAHDVPGLDRFVLDRRRRRPRHRRCRARPASAPPSTGRRRGSPPSSSRPGAMGGQAATSSMIRNYLGFFQGISGKRLGIRARFQAQRFGTRFLHRLGGRESRALVTASPHVVHTTGGDVLRPIGRDRVRGALPQARRAGDRGTARSRRLLRRRPDRSAVRLEGADVVSGGWRKLGRSGGDAPGAVRPIRHDPRPALRPRGDDVAVLDQRDRPLPQDHRRGFDPGGRRGGRCEAGVDHDRARRNG